MTTNNAAGERWHNAPIRMDGTEFYAYSVWHYPDHIKFDKVDADAVEEFLQCAGSAEAMTIERRRSLPEGGYGLFVLGHGPAEGTELVEIPWDQHVVQVYPSEVFTGEQACTVFEQYFHSATVPDGLHERRLELD